MRIRKFPEIDLKTNKEAYDLYHNDLKWVDGWDVRTQSDNFKRMLHIVDFTDKNLNNTSCLDVGCGTGDFSQVLREFGIKRYLGVDIYEPSIIRAKEKYPQEDFRLLDILSEEIGETFDYTFCSGALSIKLKEIDNYDFLESMVAKMWELTTTGVVFNILTTDPDPDPDLFFYDKAKVLSICQAIVGDGKIIEEANPYKKQSHFYLVRK